MNDDLVHEDVAQIAQLQVLRGQVGWGLQGDDKEGSANVVRLPTVQGDDGSSKRGRRRRK